MNDLPNLDRLDSGEGGFVYVLGSAGLPLVKIGTARNPERRVRELQIGAPTKLELLWQTPGDRGLEARLHACFQAERSHGEWFDLGPEPVAAVQDVVAQLRAGEHLPRPRNFEAADLAQLAAETPGLAAAIRKAENWIPGHGQHVTVYLLRDPRDGSVRHVDETVQPQTIGSPSAMTSKAVRDWLRELRGEELRPSVELLHVLREEAVDQLLAAGEPLIGYSDAERTAATERHQRRRQRSVHFASFTVRYSRADCEALGGRWWARDI
ncbi:GIY-YIG nuclease family protein [Kitasatospora sp. NPDC101157]|uniref:GIY-YIG nuclease family protein n=1 Tax=Kitasatospora sp. NPDC101157 TaxID=3364098 RepID=UPI003815B2A2